MVGRRRGRVTFAPVTVLLVAACLLVGIAAAPEWSAAATGGGRAGSIDEVTHAPGPTFTELKADILRAEKLRRFPVSLAHLLPSLIYDTYQRRPCVETLTDNPVVHTTCASGATTSARRMVLFGDSYAGMWFPALEQLAVRQHLKLYLVARDACPFSMVQVGLQCRTWRAAAIAYIKRLNPKLIVFANENVSPIKPWGAQYSTQRFAAGITSAMRTFRHPGLTEIVLLGTPSSPSALPSACIATHLSSLTRCAVPVAKAVLGTRVAADRTATTAGGGHAVVTTSLFCAKTCPMVVAGTIVFSDHFHANRFYAALIGTALGQLLAPYGL